MYIYAGGIKTQRQNFRNGFLIQRDKKKKNGMMWVRKCMVKELSERVFTECTLTRPDCRNKLRDTRYKFYKVIK
jgi:hypothetical protein